MCYFYTFYVVFGVHVTIMWIKVENKRKEVVAMLR